jgi:aryl-alcohol dehydrogenase-like predicted oxidoreductase
MRTVHPKKHTQCSIGGLLLLLCLIGSHALVKHTIQSRHPLSASSSMVSGRRKVLLASSSSFFGSLFSSSSSSAAAKAGLPARPTNEVVKVVNGMKHRRLGGSDIVVSELGLGTQRWVSDDYNAPDKDLCYQFLDRAVLEGGVNLIDTAEQYPIPSGSVSASEGDTELLIGQWLKDRKFDREKVVIATKITGGRNVTPKNIAEDCEGSLRRLQTDYVDVYQLHWPQRYSPQSNWGQSLMYHQRNDANPYWRASGGPTSFHDLCLSMQKLIDQGKIRGWGLCNDNAYGLAMCSATAKALGTTPPCTLQGDFSLIDRKSEENGVAEAASPYNENVGFMSYNALAGGMLTGKYLTVPAALDDLLLSSTSDGKKRGEASLRRPRGRMDTKGWGGTLFRYRTQAAQYAIQEYASIAKRHGMPLAELALRWCRQRDMVTTTLVGHTSMEQLEQSLRYMTMDKPLDDGIMWEIDMVRFVGSLGS